jgi:WD40 repeat protein
MHAYRILFLLLVGISVPITMIFAITSKKPIAMSKDKSVPQPVEFFTCPRNHAIDDLLFTPDGTLLVGIGLDQDRKLGVIHFWSMKNQELTRTIHEPDSVAAAVFTNESRRLITACWDHKVRVYKGDKWELKQTFDYDPPRQTANHLAVFPDGKHFLSGNVGDQGPRIWDLTKQSATPLKAPRETVNGLAISKDGKRFAIAYSAPVTEIWDAEKMEVIGRLRLKAELGGGRRGVFTCLALSPDGRTIATGCISIDGNPGKNALCIWDARSYALLHESDRLDEYPVKIAFTPDSKLLISCIGPDPQSPGTVHIWEVATGKLVHKFEAGKQGGMLSALSPDGRWLVAWNSVTNGQFGLWDVAKIRKEIGK